MQLDTLIRPAADEYAPFYAGYIAQVEDGDVRLQTGSQIRDTVALLDGLSDEGAELRYGADKWSIKEVVGHLADAERIMAYRMLRIARGDETPLEGFDENAYVPAARCDSLSLQSLLDELRAVRAATLALERNLPAEAWTRSGTANGHRVSARALAYIIAGHELHHRAILRERYLPLLGDRS
jgi:uncharacterized damage-inducible protein DinB